jgi:hypothetical protein
MTDPSLSMSAAFSGDRRRRLASQESSPLWVMIVSHPELLIRQA